MKRLMEKRFTGRVNFLALIGMCLTIYFSYHLVFGERSLLSLASLKTSQASLEKEYLQTLEEKKHLEMKDVRMRPETLDGDLAIEQMSKMLGFYAPDTQVVVSSKPRT